MIEDKDDLEKNVDNKDYFKDEAFVKRWHKRNEGDAVDDDTKNKGGTHDSQ